MLMLGTMGVSPGDTGWERLFRLVFERTSHPVVLLDEDRRVVDANDAAAALWGGPRDELLGRSLADTIKPAEQLLAASAWQAFLRSGSYQGTQGFIRADGSEAKVEVAARSATIAGHRLAVFVATRGDRRSTARRPASALPLTNREREVVTLIALGRETDEIATELRISPETVRSHVRNAMAKLEAHTRAQLVAIVLSAEQALHEERAAS